MRVPRTEWLYKKQPSAEMCRLFHGVGCGRGCAEPAIANPSPPRVFTEDEYRTDARGVIAHAVATGIAIVARADGTPRIVISIPPADSTDRPSTCLTMNYLT